MPLLQIIRQGGFLYLLAGQFPSLLAPWTRRTLVLIWVYTLTQSGTGVSLVSLAEAIPVILLATLAGVFVNRRPRNRRMAIVVAIQACIT